MLRSFAATDFTVEGVVRAKRGRSISVCLPARDEEATVGAVVEAIRTGLMGRHSVVDELVVVDDSSRDATAEVAAAAGARVVTASAILADYAAGPGKGQALWKGVHVTSGDLVVFCDSDVEAFDPGFVLGLVGPLLVSDDVAFVKGFYERPLGDRPGEGGRVTELTARPLISLLHPHLGPLLQPLAGECAAPRTVLEAVPFVGGYGVDLGLLIDVSARFGSSSLVQCDLGTRVHRNRSLAELSAQALAVLQVGMARAGLGPEGRSDLPWTTLLERPGSAAIAVTTTEYPPLLDVPAYRKTA